MHGAVKVAGYPGHQHRGPAFQLSAVAQRTTLTPVLWLKLRGGVQSAEHAVLGHTGSECAFGPDCGRQVGW